ncbi:DUF2007 domain-containing protein [uncultured Sphingomonas sp.]|uniref:putative signal transducing protein n=1 Tax=uncultured Sphingomonas sp. TaxID=158754 RepID=UPI0035CA03BF
MNLVELGRYSRNEAHMVVGMLDAHGIDARLFDGETSIGEGSWFLIPVRVMVDDSDLAKARVLLPK